MRKSKFKVLALMISMVMTVGCFVPLSVNGQNGGADGFFRGGSETYDDRADIGVSGGITNESFNAPVGNGLMVMLVAGVAYSIRQIAKKKRLVKSLMIMALALVATQCKKPDQDIIHYDSMAVNIKLRTDDGAKTIVNPDTGSVDYEDGDEIIVANNGRFVGRLTYADGIFTGTITNPSTSDYLHFYHLGNVEIEGLTAGTSTGCSFSIADQINSMPVISYGHSYEKYSSGTTTYEARLENKCALVRFEVTTPQEFAATCIKGMKNTVTVGFGSASFAYGMENEGKILLPAGSGTRWAILLPQDEVPEGGEGSAFSGLYSGHRGAVPQININDYIGAGIDVVMNTFRRPEGAMNGVFTVNSDGKTVVFSKANLSYVKATKVWRFLDNQYELVEQNGSIGTDCSKLSVITLFCWGTSGYNHGAVCYMPYNTDRTQKNYLAYGDGTKNLYDCTGKADWGYNMIENGGNTNRQWRTLTNDEWAYIFTERAGASEKFARATVVNTQGIVLLPDDWSEPYADCFTGGDAVLCTDNTYTESQWHEMETAGAVFLPFAGYRYQTSEQGANTYGKMWSSSAKSSTSAYGLYYHETNSYNFAMVNERKTGLSVRLVCE